MNQEKNAISRKLKTEERKSIMRIDFCGYLRKNEATMAGPHYRALMEEDSLKEKKTLFSL